MSNFSNNPGLAFEAALLLLLLPPLLLLLLLLLLFLLLPTALVSNCRWGAYQSAPVGCPNIWMSSGIGFNGLYASRQSESSGLGKWFRLCSNKSSCCLRRKFTWRWLGVPRPLCVINSTLASSAPKKPASTFAMERVPGEALPGMEGKKRNNQRTEAMNKTKQNKTKQNKQTQHKHKHPEQRIAKCKCQCGCYS